ncbi:hypothetical protein C922_02880, partial [Plasmodium inui San Antonio 1]
MDNLEMNLLIENYIDEEKVCHNFPFRKFHLLLYAYRNYHQTVYLRKKELANVENNDRCGGSDSKDGFGGGSHEALSVDSVKSQYNYKKKKKRNKQISFGTSESFPSNISASGRRKDAQCVETYDVSNPTVTFTNTENITGSNVFAAGTSVNSPCASVEANLATHGTNDDHVEKLPGQGKNPGGKTYRRINSENRTDSFLFPKRGELPEHGQGAEDYSEQDMLKLVYYFLGKFMFSKDRKKKNKLRGKSSLLLMLEREEDARANPMVGSKGQRKRAVKGAPRGASQGRGKTGGAAEKGGGNEVEKGVKNEVEKSVATEVEKAVATAVKLEPINEAEQDVQEKLSNEETNCKQKGEEPAEGGDGTQETEVGEVRRVCTGEANVESIGDGAEVEGGGGGAELKVSPD